MRASFRLPNSSVSNSSTRQRRDGRELPQTTRVEREAERLARSTRSRDAAGEAETGR